MAESLDNDELDDIDDTELEDSELEDEDADGEPGAEGEPEEEESDDEGDESLSDMAMLAATMPMGMRGRQPNAQGVKPQTAAGVPQAAPGRSASGGKPQAGQLPGRAPGGKPSMAKQPAANRPARSTNAPKTPVGKGKSSGKGQGGNGSKALETAQKAHDALEKPHSAATKKLVDSAKVSATGMKPFTDAVKKSTDDHKTAKKDHDEHEKQLGELDQALTGDGLGLIMKGVDLLKPWIDKIMAILGKLKDALVKAFEKALRPVADFFERVWSKVVVPAFQKTVQAVSGAFNKVGDILGKVFTALKKACAVVVKAVGQVLQKLDFTIPSWVPEFGGQSLGLSKIGDTLVEWAAKMRDGGLVHGPGGPREDQVPVLMSNGEFVVNAASTAKNLTLLQAINNEGTRSSGYGAAAKSLPTTRGMQALSRSDRPQLVIVKPIGPAGDRLDRSLKVNISAPGSNHAHAQDAAVIARRSMTYAAGMR
ncbi:hypothetical protein AB0N05_35270 [Nocardia sp. NPDC051030]|uniref:hypothetical protein n=1 Tax=Nocardia sp. NPDC051030 TaxID=3155162 RepID=UPI0034339BF0